MTRSDMFNAGQALIRRFCERNDIVVPTIANDPEPTRYGTCAFYRAGVITIWIPACASIGRGGRAWSYPGHTVDRTPYGVLAHELGHHLDGAHGAAPSREGYGPDWRDFTREKPLTGYCDNDNEWFAEMFRLYVTNPDLLRLERPKTFAMMARRWKPAETRTWEHVLRDAPRQLALLRKRHAATLAMRAPVEGLV